MTEICQIDNTVDLFTNKPSVIILSDIHLNGPNNKHLEFLKYLHVLNEKLNLNSQPFLKCLIISGDFFDLLKHGYQELKNNPLNIAIFEELNKLGEKQIEILYNLGNHEISVFGNFTDSKRDFVEKITTYQIPLNSLHERNIAQYIVLTDKNTTRQIQLYDDEDQLYAEKPFRVFLIHDPRLTGSSKKSLVCHGHQFTPFLSGFGGILWDRFLKMPETVKRKISFKSRSNQAVDYSAVLDAQSMLPCRKIHSLFNHDKKFVTNILGLPPKIVRKMRKMNQGFDTVFFGHTHEQYCEIETIEKSKKLALINPGAWQDVNLPGWAEIDSAIRLYNLKCI